MKVVRRSAPRNRRRSRANTKDAAENNTDVEQSQIQNVGRGGRRRRGGRPGNGYFLEQGIEIIELKDLLNEFMQVIMIRME